MLQQQLHGGTVIIAGCQVQGCLALAERHLRLLMDPLVFHQALHSTNLLAPVPALLLASTFAFRVKSSSRMEPGPFNAARCSTVQPHRDSREQPCQSLTPPGSPFATHKCFLANPCHPFTNLHLCYCIPVPPDSHPASSHTPQLSRLPGQHCSWPRRLLGASAATPRQSCGPLTRPLAGQPHLGTVEGARGKAHTQEDCA